MKSLTINVLLILLITSCEIWSFEAKPGSWEYVTDFPGPGREEAVSFVIDDVAYVGLGLARTGDNIYNNSDSIYCQVNG